jgi:hypothetical protein
MIEYMVDERGRNDFVLMEVRLDANQAKKWKKGGYLLG